MKVFYTFTGGQKILRPMALRTVDLSTRRSSARVFTFQAAFAEASYQYYGNWKFREWSRALSDRSNMYSKYILSRELPFRRSRQLGQARLLLERERVRRSRSSGEISSSSQYVCSSKTRTREILRAYVKSPGFLMSLWEKPSGKNSRITWNRFSGESEKS